MSSDELMLRCQLESYNENKAKLAKFEKDINNLYKNKIITYLKSYPNTITHDKLYEEFVEKDLTLTHQWVFSSALSSLMTDAKLSYRTSDKIINAI